MQDFFEKNKVPVLTFLIGLILLGVGILGKKIINFGSGTKVEILDTEDRGLKLEAGTRGTEDTTMKVEIAGEIIKPGVYDLKEGSRVNDLLVAGGGFSANADRDYVAKNINLAQKLIDGAKVFIPRVSDSSNLSNSTNVSNLTNGININTASEAELDSLYGVGPATAKKIIERRPYQTTDELIKKKIVRTNVWEGIKDKVTVY